MNIEECYEIMGGGYSDVLTRLPSPKMIEKFIVRFLEDKSYEMLCQHMEAGNRAEAFRAAHTLKGVCANLSFSRLLDSAARLTEELRAEADYISDEAASLLEEVRGDYEITIDAINRFLEQQ